MNITDRMISRPKMIAWVSFMSLRISGQQYEERRPEDRPP